MAQTNVVNDIIGQARQGSVAAIIQVLNERLADSGIRTRAMLADGVLQLLCEAPTAEQLPQAETVNRIRDILEDLAPRNLRKVNINSRIVREQQLLWLEDITRDPHNQLLWSELITLHQPPFFSRIWQTVRPQKSLDQMTFAEANPHRGNYTYFWRGLIGGASLCLLLILLAWVLKHQLGISWSQAQSPTETSVPSSPQPSLPPTQDAFSQAVRIAQQAAAEGQSATTPAEWLDLAARWQRASDLMAEVPPQDDRYPVAQDRVLTYQQNSELALQQAEQLQAEDAASDFQESSAE